MPADHKDKTGKKKNDSSSSSSECKKEKKVECKDKNCELPIVIDQVPVCICKSGKYCVAKDLHYRGNDIAILVTANNVTIDFANHDLVLHNRAATGISIECVREIVIKNDAISFSSSANGVGPNGSENTAVGVNIKNSSKVLLENLFIKDVARGVFVEDSDDISIVNTHFENNSTASIKTNKVSGLVLEKIAIKNNEIVGGSLEAAIRFDNTNNILFNGLNSYRGDIFYISGNNATFEKINIVFDDDTYSFSMFQLGSAPPVRGLVSNVLVHDSNFKNSAGSSTSKGAQITNANNVIFNDVSIWQAGAVEDNTDTGILAIGLEQNSGNANSVRNVQVRNSKLFAPADLPVSFGVRNQADEGFENKNVFFYNVIVNNHDGVQIIDFATLFSKFLTF